MRFARRLRNLLSTAQQRFERTQIGEVAISALVSVIVMVSVVWSGPDSALKRAAVPPLEPVALVSGLDQAWYMFAPDPFRRLETVTVHVRTSRGDERVWTFPHGNVFDQFSWYHWHKLKEESVKVPDIRAAFTRWAAGQVVEPSEYPVRVELILKTESFPAPGVVSPQSTTGSDVLYKATLTGPP
jgi:hypothetical protein